MTRSVTINVVDDIAVEETETVEVQADVPLDGFLPLALFGIAGEEFGFRTEFAEIVIMDNDG